MLCGIVGASRFLRTGRHGAATQLHKLYRPGYTDRARPTGQNGSGITEPLSPGLRFTDTTVALGKKLNSEALAQV
jgi:hypothetical protein